MMYIFFIGMQNFMCMSARLKIFKNFKMERYSMVYFGAFNLGQGTENMLATSS